MLISGEMVTSEPSLSFRVSNENEKKWTCISYVPAPSASPFATLSNNDYVCLSYSGASLRLPLGTY